MKTLLSLPNLLTSILRLPTKLVAGASICALLLSTLPAFAAPTVTTSTTVASSVNPVAVGKPTTLTATVTGTNPTGSVTFKDGTTTLGTGTLSGTGNTRTTTYAATFTTLGTKSVTAVYAGDATNITSISAALSQTVSQASPTNTLTSSLNPSTNGKSVTFTATVVGYTPTGNVTFMDGSTTLGTVALSGTGNTRTAAYATTALGVATHSITAVYVGDTLNNSASSAAVSQVVKTAATTASVTSSLNPSSAGATVTFTASITGVAPTGVVTFKDGAATLGTGTLSGTGNTRTTTLATNALSVGAHSIKVVYPGDAGNATVTSAALNQTVNAAVTTTLLTTNANPAMFGQPVVLTATIAGAAPTGTVTFIDAVYGVLGTGTISSGVSTYSSSTLAFGSYQITAQYAGDAKNQGSTSTPLLLTVSPGMMTWKYGYDAAGRLTTAVDPSGNITYTYYDALGHPIHIEEPMNANEGAPTITEFAYNALEAVTQVTDPRYLVTSYEPNGLGNVTTQTSPDTGVSAFTHDANGNVLTKTDARGKVTTYTYDALNRLTRVAYTSGTASVLEYDGGSTPVPGATGQLTKVTDESGSVSYAFDAIGRLVSKTQITKGKTFTVSYTWGDTGAALDKITAITYPSGTRVNYAYSAFGKISDITVNSVNSNGSGVSGTAVTLLSAVTPHPLGGVSGWTWASGKSQTYGYDSFGQINSYNLGNPSGTGTAAGSKRTLLRDSAGRITGYSHANSAVPQSTLDQSFGYDNLNRLIAANQGSSAIQYTYDTSGNRTGKVISGNIYSNTVDPSSNILTETQDVSGTATIQADVAGNITSDAVNTYAYSARGRLSSATTAGGVVNYSYNALEQRVYKNGPTALVPTGAAYYVYDEAGQLLGEYNATGVPLYETIYLGSIPVGVLKQTGTAAGNNLSTSFYNVSSDQLGAPRVITRQNDEAIVWRWDSAEAFGATAPNQNPSALGTFSYNQRLPGQVFDAESGLFQNWNREYNARLGRYIQSDPIGLKGGINTYSYVGGNPVSYVDPMGLIRLPSNPLDLIPLEGSGGGGGGGGGLGRSPVSPKVSAPQCPPGVKNTLDRIKAGEGYPHRNDGSVFGNKEGLLPAKPDGYYREWVHPTPGVQGPGAQRVITGQDGKAYYSPDHYRTFIPIE